MKKQIKASAGKFLETFSPAYSIAKGKGPIGEAVRGKKGMGLLGLAAAAADKDKKSPGSQSMQANQMQGMAKLSGGGSMKRSRPIDGIASKGKTKGRMI